MRLIVHPDIFDRFPGLRLAVAVASGIDNHTPRPDLLAAWHQTWAEAGAQAAPYGNAQSHPRVTPWGERFRAMGISRKEFPSSIEALLRRTLKGGEPFSINPLVDFYNTISLCYTVPAGGFDLDHIAGPIELRLTREGDHFTALGTDIAEPVPPGEVAYTDGSTVLTRHFVWRQSRDAALTPDTRSLFLVSEILGEVGPEVAEQVLAGSEAGLREYFDVAPQTFMLDHNRTYIDW